MTFEYDAVRAHMIQVVALCHEHLDGLVGNVLERVPAPDTCHPACQLAHDVSMCHLVLHEEDGLVTVCLPVIGQGLETDDALDTCSLQVNDIKFIQHPHLNEWTTTQENTLKFEASNRQNGIEQDTHSRCAMVATFAPNPDDIKYIFPSMIVFVLCFQTLQLYMYLASLKLLIHSFCKPTQVTKLWITSVLRTLDGRCKIFSRTCAIHRWL